MKSEDLKKYSHLSVSELIEKLALEEKMIEDGNNAMISLKF